jgi:hypothetical protein
MNGITHEIIPGCLQHNLFDRIAPAERLKYSIIDNASAEKSCAIGYLECRRSVLKNESLESQIDMLVYGLYQLIKIV